MTQDSNDEVVDGSVSLTNDRIAMGYIVNEGGDLNGIVKVFHFNSTSWVQVHTDIERAQDGDRTGVSIGLSYDGTRIVVGSNMNDINGVDAGLVRVFEYNSTDGLQLGSSIEGESAGDQLGRAVSLSYDGNRVAIGGLYNSAGGTEAGHVRVYEYDSSSWVQLGSDIDGEANNERIGTSVSLSANGTRVAVGGFYNVSNGGSRASLVRVFEYNSTSWNQLGSDMFGAAMSEGRKYFVSLSADGSRVALGSELNDDNAIDAGVVNVYEYDSSSWNQLGNSIYGENAGDRSGRSVVLSANGERIGVGDPGYGGFVGQVRVFDFDALSSSWVQVGAPLNVIGSVGCGNVLAMSPDGNRIATGALANNSLEFYTWQLAYLPTSLPSSQPTSLPSAQSTVYPTGQPSVSPSLEPTSCPTGIPTISPIPTGEPSCQPSAQPSSQPSITPTVQPSESPSSTPSSEPSRCPSGVPSLSLLANVPTFSGQTNCPTVDPTLSPTQLPTFEQLNPPILQDCRFANDGSYFLMQFDRATDRGNQGRNYPCDFLLDFVGVDLAMCSWHNRYALKIYPTGEAIGQLNDSVLIDIGGVVTVKENILRSMCPNEASDEECAFWPTATNISCAVSGPLSAISPVVSITAPSVLSQCKSFTLDLTASSGSGGRDWASININVSSVSNSSSSLVYLSQIMEFYNSNYSLYPPSALPAGYLVGNETYVITVQLCNFLKKCQTAYTSVSMLNLNAIPIVTIAGRSSRQLRRSDSLSLLSSAYVGTCNSTNRYSGMIVSWNVSEDGVANQLLSSTSRNPFRFLLPGNVLNVGSNYIITVSVKDSLYGGEAYSAVSALVVPSNVIAVITGGEQQIWRVGDNDLVLNGSESFDMDVGEGLPGQGLSYEWACGCNESTMSLNANFCDIVLPNSSRQASHISLNMSGMDLSGAIGSIFSITLSVYGSFNRSDSAVTSVVIAESASPKISLLSYPQKINIQKSLKVLSSVEVTLYSTGVWSMNDDSVDLEAISSMPSLNKVFPRVGSYEFNMAIEGSSLESGLTYSFILTVTGYTDIATAQVLVEVVELPHSGDLTVSPSVGTELQNFFSMATSRWVDDELPLSYSFGYFTTTSGGIEGMLELQGRSEAAVMGGKHLPRGFDSNSFNRACGVYAFNNLDAKNVRTFSVQVNPVHVSAEELEELISTQLETVSEFQDVNAVKSVVAAGVSVLNVANCSMAPSDCGGSFSRMSCDKTPHTCGPCVEGYMGESEGDGNSPCYIINSESVSNSDTANISCANYTECPKFQACVDGICSYFSKSCPSDCSGHGVCQAHDILRGVEISSCLINDFSCLVSCDCDDEYFGEGCSEIQSAIASKKQARLELISSINATILREDKGSDWIMAQVALVMELGDNPSELLRDSCVILNQIIETVLEAAFETDIATTSLEGLLSVLDNCDQVYVSAVRDANISSSESYSALGDNKRLRAVFNKLTSQNMIAGERDMDFIQTSTRTTVSRSNINVASVHTVPLTSLESFFSLAKSSVQIAGYDFDGNFERSVFLEESSIELVSNNSQFTSNPLKIQYSISSTSKAIPAEAGNPFVLVVLQYVSPQDYYVNDRNLTSTFETYCQNWTVPSVHNITCSNNETVHHHCTHPNQIFRTVCPKENYLPVCHTLSTNDEAGSEFVNACELVDYTFTNVTCNCTISLQQLSSARRREFQKSENVHRASASTLESSGFIEIVSMSEYTYDGFISTNSEITNVTVKDIQSSLFVIIMFATLWGCGLLGIYELFKANYCCPATERQVAPMPRERNKADVGRNFSLDKKKEHLWNYVDGIIPVVFCSKTQSTLRSLWKAIISHHSYAEVLTARGPGAKEQRIYKGIHLLTIQSMLMFIMAVFCDLQVLIDYGCFE